MTTTYIIENADGLKSIFCRRCRRRSFHPKDIEHRFCGACGFHDVDLSTRSEGDQAALVDAIVERTLEPESDVPARRPQPRVTRRALVLVALAVAGAVGVALTWEIL